MSKNEEYEVSEGEIVTPNNDTRQYSDDKVKSSGKTDLSLKQRKFIKEYMNTGHITKSAIKAGYSEASASSYGSQLLKNPKVLAVLNKNVEGAERAIVDVMNTESGMTKLAAAKELLDRTIGKPIQRSENVNVNISVESMLDSLD